VGFVSTQTPLLSNLSMLENIILISQVHENINYKKSKEKGLLALESLGIGHIAHYRYVDCSTQEKFYAQLIRANMMKDAKIIMEQPFRLLDEQIKVSFILNALEKLNIDTSRLHILDLQHMQPYYEESHCLIKKY